MKRKRAKLAEFGLTPEQYLTTIDPSDAERVAEAKDRFGIR